MTEKISKYDKDYLLYCDGSTQTNPGIGAWAAIIVSSRTGVERITVKAYEHTTNNRMELLGVIEPLEDLVAKETEWNSDPVSVGVYSDSKYVVNSLPIWLSLWATAGWLNKQGKRVKNVDVLQRYLNIKQYLDISFIWVKGHSGNELNERCDVLARASLTSPNKHKDM